VGEEPEEEREGGAKYKAGHDGEVERSVFAAMDDVARKAAKAEGQSATKVEKSAGKDKKASKQEESASEFTNGVHYRILLQAADKPFPGPVPVIQQIPLYRLLFIKFFILSKYCVNTGRHQIGGHE